MASSGMIAEGTYSTSDRFCWAHRVPNCMLRGPCRRAFQSAGKSASAGVSDDAPSGTATLTSTRSGGTTPDRCTNFSRAAIPIVRPA